MTRSTFWLVIILPMAVIGGLLGGAAAFLETLLRHGDNSWEPLHPIRSAAISRHSDDLEPPVQADE